MYLEYFGLTDTPFSIAPDPRFLYMSERHREALAHLLYGVSGQGGFVVLTGEVGTGKTTICRCFLEQVPDNTDVAFVVNPKLSARELLATVCDELGIKYTAGSSIKIFNDLINSYLLNAHSQGRHTVLIIDEAQNLRVDVLEQLRLLTNLETSEKKLLQIILLGQPELKEMLARVDLRQLAQRITARYHLQSLSREEMGAYLQYRLSVAGQKRPLFTAKAIKKIFNVSGGVPRLINLICDRALLGTYASNASEVDTLHVNQAVKEIGVKKPWLQSLNLPSWLFSGASIGAAAGFLMVVLIFGIKHLSNNAPTPTPTSITTLPKILSLAADNGAVSPHDLGGQQNNHPQIAIKQLLANESLANSKRLAYESLMSVWDVNLAKGKNRLICRKVEQTGLRCLHKQGNWRSLLDINRPVVLHLRNSLSKNFDITLVRLEEAQALIMLNGLEYWVSRSDIDQYWLGEYSLFWKLPDYLSRLIKPGMITDKDKWLRLQLSKVSAVLNVPAFNASFVSSHPVKKSVQYFQRSQGLVDDGLVGAMTIIKLNSVLQIDVPKLRMSTPQVKEDDR